MLADTLAFIVFLLVNLAAASSGAFFRPGQWYRNLRKPAWRPPDWLFGPVWAVLYLLIAISGWLVWRTVGDTGSGRLALSVYSAQLVLNAAWPAVFFGLRRPGWGVVEIIGLWGSILATIVAFFPLSRAASYMLIPYLLWVSFASVLNLRVWQLNRRLQA